MVPVVKAVGEVAGEEAAVDLATVVLVVVTGLGLGMEKAMDRVVA
jgi:hypothetical protein